MHMLKACLNHCNSVQAASVQVRVLQSRACIHCRLEHVVTTKGLQVMLQIQMLLQMPENGHISFQPPPSIYERSTCMQAKLRFFYNFFQYFYMQTEVVHAGLLAIAPGRLSVHHPSSTRSIQYHPVHLHATERQEALIGKYEPRPACGCTLFYNCR